MARPLICRGGYPVPEAQGMFDIVGISVAPTAIGTAMEVELRDDWNYDQTWDPENDKHEIVKIKHDGNDSVFHMFTSPIKVLRGIRATTLTNATRVLVYVR